MKYLIFSALVFIGLWFELKGDRRYFAALTVSLVSFSAEVFRDFEVYFPISAIMVTVSAVFMTKRDYINIANTPRFSILMFFFASSSLLIGAIVFSYSNDKSISELISYSMYPIVVLVFYAKFFNVFLSSDVDRYIVWPFVIGIFFNLLSVIFVSVDGFGFVPDFFRGAVVEFNEDVGGEYVLATRYGGLVGDYELIVDYCFMVIAFSVVLYGGNHRIVPVLAVVAAFAVGLMSGTRSFVVGSMAGIFLYFLVDLVVRWSFRKFIKMFFFTMLLSFSAVWMYINYGENMLVFQRLVTALNVLNEGGGVEATINRSLSKAAVLVVNDASVLGLGAFKYSEFEGNEIVSHNILLALYMKYGVLGVMSYITLMVVFLYRLFRIARRTRNNRTYFISIVLITLHFILFFQEFKISAIRSLTGVLMYLVVYMYMYAFIRKERLEENKCHIL